MLLDLNAVKKKICTAGRGVHSGIPWAEEEIKRTLKGYLCTLAYIFFRAIKAVTAMTRSQCKYRPQSTERSIFPIFWADPLKKSSGVSLLREKAEPKRFVCTVNFCM